MNPFRWALLWVAVSLLAFRFDGKKNATVSTTADSVQVPLRVSPVASGLNVPWEMVWGPDGWIWFTEQSGTISRLNPGTGEKELLAKIDEVYRYRSLGLLGMALHPDFARKPYVFVDYTCRKDSVITTRLVRFTYRNHRLVNPKTLLEIPASTGHNGSRITISPDGKIMFATGDAITITNAQRTTSLNGKVLRINLDGSVPADNPIRGSLVWSWGHRNIQGLTYGKNGILYSSEHGDAVEDELNVIEKSKNYGWPLVEGFCDQPHEKRICDSMPVKEPVRSWTPTIAPAGIAWYDGKEFPEWKNALLLTTLKENDLRVLHLDPAGQKVTAETIVLDQQFGRLRAICVAPDGSLYVSTSNRDWNPGAGYPKENDDQILHITRGTPGSVPIARTARDIATQQPKGEKLYRQYCASCHKPDGGGIPEIFPPLQGTPQVKDQNTLLRIILAGLSGKVEVSGKTYDQHMPAMNFLSDDAIADIATYVRQHFTNNEPAVSAADVVAARKNL